MNDVNAQFREIRVAREKVMAMCDRLRDDVRKDSWHTPSSFRQIESDMKWLNSDLKAYIEEINKTDLIVYKEIQDGIDTTIACVTQMTLLVQRPRFKKYASELMVRIKDLQKMSIGHHPSLGQHLFDPNGATETGNGREEGQCGA